MLKFRMRYVLVAALATMAFFAAAASATTPYCGIGTPTSQGHVYISFPSAFVAQANVSGFGFCGTTVAAYQFYWSNGGANSSQTSVMSNETITVTVVPCVNNPDIGCSTGTSATDTETAPDWGGTPPPPGGGGGTAGTSDKDGDGVPDVNDNCPSVSNVNQADADHNGVGDACQTTFMPLSQGTTELSEDAELDPTYQPCNYLGRCIYDAAAKPGELCGTVADSVHINWGVYNFMHQKVILTPCFLQSAGIFTRIKGTPMVQDLTCGAACTYPWQTSYNGPGIQFPSPGRMVVSTQFTMRECPIYVGFACSPGITGTLTTTYVVFAGFNNITKAISDWRVG